MSIEIKKVNDRHYTVNGKNISQDMEDNWLAFVEFTPSETKAFYEHLAKKPIILEQVEQVLLEVKSERIKQELKWGQQNHKPIEWIPILGEEVGEVNKALLETYFGYDGAKGYEEYRKELIQVAAVAVAMVESLDRNVNLR